MVCSVVALPLGLVPVHDVFLVSFGLVPANDAAVLSFSLTSVDDIVAPPLGLLPVTGQQGAGRPHVQYLGHKYRPPQNLSQNAVLEKLMFGSISSQWLP